MILSHIVAMSENQVIGKDNKLPWHLPEDLKFFREKTKNHIIIMGRKTFDSLKSPLPNRLHIVITRSSDTTPRAANVIYVNSLAESIEKAKDCLDQWGSEVFIIGGGEIFKQSMEMVDRIYLTIIHKNIDGDVNYPEWSKDMFTLTEQRDLQEPIPFSFQTWERKEIDFKVEI